MTYISNRKDKHERVRSLESMWSCIPLGSELNERIPYEIPLEEPLQKKVCCDEKLVILGKRFYYLSYSLLEKTNQTDWSTLDFWIDPFIFIEIVSW